MAEISEHIVNIVTALRHQYINVIKDRYLWSSEMFRKEFQIVSLSLPRQTGHSTAAMQLITVFPDSLLITRTDALQTKMSNIMDIQTFKHSGVRATEIATIARLKGNLDFVILDDVCMTESEIDMIFNVLDPHLLVKLGRIACE